jgi:hypothetical protein
MMKYAKFIKEFDLILVMGGIHLHFFLLRIHPVPANTSMTTLLADGSNNAFVTDSEYLSYLEKSLKSNQTFTKLNEKIVTNHWGFYFYTNQFIFKAFNKKIPQLVESGIADYIIKNEARYNKNITEAPAAPLTFNHLDCWFRIVLILLGIATVVFIGEILSSFMTIQCLNSGMARRLSNSDQTME